MAGQTTKSKEGATQHWCLAANLRFGIYNGEMIFDKLLGPQEISIPMKW